MSPRVDPAVYPRKSIHSAARALWRELEKYPQPKQRDKKRREADWYTHLHRIIGNASLMGCDEDHDLLHGMWHTLYGPYGIRGQDKRPAALVSKEEVDWSSATRQAAMFGPPAVVMIDAVDVEWVTKIAQGCEVLMRLGRQHADYLQSTVRERRAKTEDPEMDWLRGCLSLVNGLRTLCLQIAASPDARFETNPAPPEQSPAV